MGASAAYNDAFDGCAADATGLASAGVDVVVKLEETGYSIGVYVVRDGGAA